MSTIKMFKVVCCAGKLDRFAGSSNPLIGVSINVLDIMNTINEIIKLYPQQDKHRQV